MTKAAVQAFPFLAVVATELDESLRGECAGASDTGVAEEGHNRIVL